jgi:hypothetical protein
MSIDSDFAQKLRNAADSYDIGKVKALISSFNKGSHQKVIESEFARIYTSLDKSQNTEKIKEILKTLYPIVGRDKALENTIAKVPDVDIHLAQHASFDEWYEVDRRAKQAEEDWIRSDKSDDFGANPATYQVHPKHQGIVSEILDEAEEKSHVHADDKKK